MNTQNEIFWKLQSCRPIILNKKEQIEMIPVLYVPITIKPI